MPQIVILAFLIQLYLVVVVGHYLDELADRNAADQYGVDIDNPIPPYRFDVWDEEKQQRTQGR
jgi:predicted xylose isomerase-like sugar epimerase